MGTPFAQSTNDENAHNAGATDDFVECRSFLPTRSDSGIDCARGLVGHIDNGHSAKPGLLTEETGAAMRGTWNFNG